MKKPYFLILFLIISNLLSAEEDIYVHLDSQCATSPVYVHLYIEKGSTISQVYAVQLKKVLEFDLSHNGKAYIVSTQPQHLAQVKKEKSWKDFEKTGWESLGVDYVVKLRIDNTNCSLAAFSVKENKIKGVEAILSGNLNTDRQKIHTLSDTLAENIFHTKGVASSKLVYTVSTKKTGDSSDKWLSEIWESDYDGFNAHQVSDERSLALTPVFLKQGELLYVSYKSGQPKIYQSSLNGTSKRVALTAGNQFTPALSPKRDAIAYICDALGNPDLFIQRFDATKGAFGKPKRLFSSPLGAQGSPCFSPDGKKIAFVSNKDGSPRIYTLSLSGGSPQLITKQNNENTCPTWSPDGKKLAYSSLTGGIRQIWIYDFDTKKEWQLTDGPTHKENPSFAANSLHLVFNSVTSSGGELYLVNLLQKDVFKVSTGAGEKRFPCWE